MELRFKLTRKRIVIVITGVALVLTGVAVAVTGNAYTNATGAYNGCVGQGSGLLRVLAVGETCRQNEVPIDWNQVGPQGPQGIQGPKGDKGDTGATGAQGAKGDQGIQGPAGTPGAAGADGFSCKDIAGAVRAECKGEKGDKGDKGDPGASGSLTSLNALSGTACTTSDNRTGTTSVNISASGAVTITCGDLPECVDGADGTIPHGTRTCVGGSWTNYVCDSGYHQSGASCVADAVVGDPDPTGNTKGSAVALGTFDDCDGSGGTFSGQIANNADNDWYQARMVDNTFCQKGLIAHLTGSVSPGTLSVTVETTQGTASTGLGGTTNPLSYGDNETVYFHVSGSGLATTPGSYTVDFHG
jgi:hypothetical protein